MVKELVREGKNIALYFLDEMRYGLISNYRRSWSKKGKRVVIKNQMEFSSAYLYSAIAPLTAETEHLIGFSKADSTTTEIFLKELKKKHPNEQLMVIWDNAPFHKKKTLADIEGLSILALPTYSPQLNPVERFFEELRKATANRIFANLEEQTKLISQVLISYDNDSEAVKRLTAYDWIVRQYQEAVS